MDDHKYFTSPRLVRWDDAGYDERAASMLSLMRRVWPSEGEPDVAGAVARWRRQETRHFVVEDAGEVVAHAAIFAREMFAQGRAMRVGCLAGVCVREDLRGRGLGRDVVRAAFGCLAELGAPVCLFQTDVPGFYEGLGARPVTNRFRNGEEPGNPFWGSHTMIFPASFAWPEGDVDINGPGF